MPRSLPGWLLLIAIVGFVIAALGDLKTESDTRRAECGYAMNELPAWARKQ